MSILTYIFCALLVVNATIVSRGRIRQVLLLAASYLFYATFGRTFLLVLLASSLFNFAYGAFLKRKPTLSRLCGGVAANVALLGFFKATHILVGVAGSGSAAGKFLAGIAMPLGISFWTFQALSYLFDVYRQEDLDPSLLEFCLYLGFWPTVIMGPICRLENMLPQLREGKPFSASNLLLGLRRVTTGLFMKLVVSQLLFAGLTEGAGVAAGFDGAATAHSGLDVWFLAIGFGLQLFFDFAGYSHIMIGLARIFGFQLDENFDAPFVAATPSEFWNRWHMSLSSWIRDYVFIPVATARRGAWWRYFALLFSMTLFGLWHGAKSTFILWGAYQGVLLIGHRMIQQVRRGRAFELPSVLDGPLSWAVSFLCVSLGWVLFRANSLSQAVSMVGAVFSLSSYSKRTLPASYYALVVAVLFGYMAYELVFTPLARKTWSALKPEIKLGLVQWGITRDFATFVWFIPMAAILFLGVLLAFSGSAGVSSFVYAVF